VGVWGGVGGWLGVRPKFLRGEGTLKRSLTDLAEGKKEHQSHSDSADIALTHARGCVSWEPVLKEMTGLYEVARVRLA